MGMAPMGSSAWTLGPQLMELLEKVRRCGLNQIDVALSKEVRY